MKYYKSADNISAGDLLLLEMEPDTARKSWCLRLDLPKLSKKATFIPLWIEGDEIVFLSKICLTNDSFDLDFNYYEKSEIKKWIEKNLGENFFLLSKEEAERVPKEILCCNNPWWLRSPSNYNIFSANYVYYDGSISFINVRNTNLGVRPACRIKYNRRK